MSYEAWRISYQDSEQAARAAFAETERLKKSLVEIERENREGWKQANFWRKEYETLTAGHMEQKPPSDFLPIPKFLRRGND